MMPVIGEAVSLTIDSILLPTDFSPASEKAVLFAKAIAKRFGSSVTLVHVLNLSLIGNVNGISISIVDLEKEAAKELDRLAGKFSDAQISVQTSLLNNLSPSGALLQIAKNTGPGLIIMGTSSKQGFEKLFLGSIAEEVIRKAECPVLTVGPNTHYPSTDIAEFRNIVYATDFSAQAAKAAIYALSFAEDSQANLYLCHVLDVWSPKAESRLSMERTFEAALKNLIPNSAYDWCNPECVVEHGNPVEAILGLAGRVKADILVLGARKSSFWLTHVEQGMTPALLASATCPVLTIN
jgi:nucleotide-binding universal stress UspA family protein